MFGMLRMAMTLLICILAVGFYLGWFSFTRPVPDPKSDKVNFNVSVDQNKVRSDLEKAEQNLARRIQDVNQPQGPGGAPPQGPSGAAPAGRRPLAPGLNFGPISVQPSAPPAGSPGLPPAGPPAMNVQTPDFQFTVPLGPPPPEGR